MLREAGWHSWIGHDCSSHVQAQFLKNLTSNKTETINAAACKRLGDHVKTRWCMTGTPAENNIKDYFSLLTFLHAEPFCQEIWFKNHVERDLALIAIGVCIKIPVKLVDSSWKSRLRGPKFGQQSRWSIVVLVEWWDPFNGLLKLLLIVVVPLFQLDNQG